MQAKQIVKKIKSLLHPGETLSQRASRSGVWVYATQIAEQGIRLVRVIIVARLLVPDDFGLMGIAAIAMAFLETLSTTGFREALIQKKENTEGYLDTAWTVLVMRGVILALVLFGIAPFVATFFNSSAASSILKVVAISCVLSGLANIGVVYFQKELEFGKRFLYLLSGTIADFIVAVTAALILQSVWALVFGLLARVLVQCIISYIIHPYRPRLHFQLEQAKELFGFGKWILALSILVFLASQGDSAFLGKVLGVTVLGFYQLALRFGNVPSRAVGVVSRVAFPTYSKLQDNISILRDTYLRITRLVTFATIPLAGGIFILAPQFTQIFLGDKWMPMVPALRILAISSLIAPIIATGDALYNAVGRPRLSFMRILTRVLTLAAGIYPLTMLWGMSGIALAVLLSFCANIPIWFFFNAKLVGIGVRDYVGILLPPLVATAVMCVLILALGMSLNQFQLPWFIISVLIGMIIYFGLTLFIEKISDYAVYKDMKFIFNSLRP